MILKNCKIVTEKEIFKGDILIEDRKIKKIGVGLKGKEKLDVKGKPVIPGIIDVHVHARDFDQRYKEDFESCSKAAIANGVTFIADMPNTSPPVIDEKKFKLRIELAKRKCLVNFGIIFGITNENKKDAEKVHPFAYKIYMDGTLGEISQETLKYAIKNFFCCIHAEGEERTPESEEKAVKKICRLAEKFKNPCHICHISYRGSLKHLNKYTTCEVTPHHLLLTYEDFKRLGSIAKVNPPLKTREDNKALLLALKKGRIPIIASDHAPHSLEEKESENPPPGIPNLDVMLKLLLTLAHKKILDLHTIVRATSKNPAKIFGLKTKGEIKVGYDADLVVLDLEKRGTIEPEEFYSKAKYSPFSGWKTYGGVDTVVLGGKLAFYDQEIILKK